MKEIKKVYRGMENGAETIDENFKEFLERLYPVGFVYISTKSTNPGDLVGGVWEQIASGRTLVGVDTSDESLNQPKKVGGKVNPLSEHYHPLEGKTYRVTTAGSGTGTNTLARSTDVSSAMDGTIANVTAASRGDNKNHNNWQPFMVVYFWERVE